MNETGFICRWFPGETITGWLAITEAFLNTPPPVLQGVCWTCKETELIFGIDVVTIGDAPWCERDVEEIELISVELEVDKLELRWLELA